MSLCFENTVAQLVDEQKKQISLLLEVFDDI